MEHDGKWQKVTIKMINGHQYIGALIWLDPNKRVTDMLNNDEAFLPCRWSEEYYCIAKASIMWVNEHIGMKDVD